MDVLVITNMGFTLTFFICVEVFFGIEKIPSAYWDWNTFSTATFIICLNKLDCVTWIAVCDMLSLKQHLLKHKWHVIEHCSIGQVKETLIAHVHP